LTGDLTTNILVIILVVFVVWYGIGTFLNRHRAQGALRSIRVALPELGARFRLRPRGNSGLEITVVEPRPPFASVTLYVVLEPREIVVLWPVDRFIRRKRDHLILRADLIQRPTSEILLADPLTPLGKLALDGAKGRGLTTQPVSARGAVRLERWTRSRASEKAAGEFMRRGIQDSLPLWVLATQKKSPQLLLICGLSRIDADEMRMLLRRVRELAWDSVREDASGA
jgi:hypothetical protein